MGWEKERGGQLERQRLPCRATECLAKGKEAREASNCSGCIGGIGGIFAKDIPHFPPGHNKTLPVDPKAGYALGFRGRWWEVVWWAFLGSARGKGWAAGEAKASMQGNRMLGQREGGKGSLKLAHTHKETQISTQKHTHKHTQTNTHTNTHKHTQTHTHTHTQTHTNTLTHKHTQTHTHTHTQVCV